MAKFLVWRPDYGGTRDDAREVEAYDMGEAAEKWADKYDRDSAEYLIVGGQDAELMVELVGGNGKAYKYIVSGDAVPSYRARMVVTPNVALCGERSESERAQG